MVACNEDFSLVVLVSSVLNTEDGPGRVFVVFMHDRVHFRKGKLAIFRVKRLHFIVYMQILQLLLDDFAFASLYSDLRVGRKATWDEKAQNLKLNIKLRLA